MTLLRPQRLYTAEQVRELDRRAIEDHGVDGFALMTRAAEAAFRLLRLRWPAARRIAVACGGGNNGGDGLVLARLARDAGLQVSVGLAGDPERLRGAAATAWQQWNGAAVALHDLRVDQADVRVDALLGTGLDRPVAGAIGAAIESLNSTCRPTLAVDIPSGLAADSGAVLGTAVRADMTITFIGAKRGLYTGGAIDHAGTVLFDDLAVPAQIYAGMDAAVTMPQRASLAASLPRRAPGTHKGDVGHVLVVGGGSGFAGAARLAGEAAARAGAGLVSVATRPEHVVALVAGCPALMAHGVSSAPELTPLLSRVDVVAVGPGLGRSDWAREMLQCVLEAAPRHLVIDADGLNLLGETRQSLPVGALLTPHPGEAARLLDQSVAEVQADRFTSVQRLAQQFGATTLLKGPGTLLATDTGGAIELLPGAEPALAVGGSGDVLTGIAAGLRAQGCSAAAAASCAALLLQECGRKAASAVGTNSVLPTDLLAALGPALIRVRDD